MFAELEDLVEEAVFGQLSDAIATYTPAVGAPTVFNCAYDNRAEVDEFSVIAAGPSITFRVSDFQSLAEGMTISIARNNPVATSVGSFVVRSVVNNVATLARI